MLREQLAEWRKRLGALDGEILSKTIERDRLRANIAAASTILGVPMNSDYSAPQEKTLIEEITGLMGDGRARSPTEIRRELIARGMARSKVGSTVGNFYNSLTRLVGRGVLTKRSGDKRYVIKPGGASDAS